MINWTMEGEYVLPSSVEPDDRKRSYEGVVGEAPAPIDGQPKRSRPEDANFGIRDDPAKATTRIFLNRNQFSRVIGKGGATIAHIRAKTAVYMRGADITEDQRMIFLNGTLEQVLNAFDMITEMLHQSAVVEQSQFVPRGHEVLSLVLLLDHNKAGKVVGAKGHTILNVKMKSGCMSLRMDKEPEELLGVNLRKLTIEGTLNSVRRAHLLVQELFVDPSVFAHFAHVAGGAADSQYRPGYGGQQQYESQGGGGGGGGHHGESSAFPHSAAVPFPTLVNFGVQAETVRQLTEMKAYLWRHFGLELSINREVTPSPSQGQVGPMPRGSDPYGGGFTGSRMGNSLPGNRDAPPARRPSHTPAPGEVTFTIPKICVGAVIGKGGFHLKDLMSQYGVKVYVDKDDVGGKRTVILSFAGGEGFHMSEQEALARCQQHIEATAAEQLSKVDQQQSEGFHQSEHHE